MAKFVNKDLRLKDGQKVTFGDGLDSSLTFDGTEFGVDTVMSGMGLCVLYIGISGSLKGQNILVTIGSIALGITKIKAANLSLAPFIPIFIYLFI